MSDLDNKCELDIVIKEAKQELKTMFLKRRDIIIKLEEIVNNIISSRDIERYCCNEWKKKTKPQKNANLSFLTKTEEQEKVGQKTIAIDTHGSSIDELKSITTTQTCNKENNCNLQPQAKSENIQNNAINLHTCPNCKQPQVENQRICNEKDIKIKELHDELHQYYNDLKLKQVKDEDNGSVSSSFNTYNQSESSTIIDLEFPLRYEEVRRYVSSRLKISGVLGTLWFNCKLDKRTFRIISAYPGSIVERNALAKECN